jgi:hypothetical protein
MTPSPLKLLVEQPKYDIECIIEEKNSTSPQNLYIQGPFLMSETKNKNGRIYPLNEMQVEVQRYVVEMVDRKRALGELNHPASVDVNPERASHLITKMWQEGNLFYGKAKILNTPVGNVVKSLVMEGVQLGVSSRALGKLTQTNEGNVVSNLHLVGVDVVHDPSCDRAFVDGILESKAWIINPDGSITEALEKFYSGVKTMPVGNRDEYIKNLIIGFLNNVK